MFDVACVGILVADILAKPVAALPDKGLLGLVDSIELFSGGNAMTAAINLKKMGLNPALIGKVGTDPWGDFLMDCLRKNGVAAQGVTRCPTVQTSASVALSDAGGERTFLHCTGANAAFSRQDINMDIIRESKIVFVTGTYLLDAFDGAQTAEFLKDCKRLGKTTALDVCWDSRDRWDSLLAAAMPYIDIFMPSIDEAKKIAHADEPDKIADQFFAAGVGSVVIKLGKDGCYLRESAAQNGMLVPACRNVTAVDATGAGDSFCSGFLAALSRGKGFVECAKFGNAAGACCVMAKGAATGIKNYSEIEKFMEVHL